MVRYRDNGHIKMVASEYPCKSVTVSSVVAGAGEDCGLSGPWRTAAENSLGGPSHKLFCRNEVRNCITVRLTHVCNRYNVYHSASSTGLLKNILSVNREKAISDLLQKI